MVQDANKGIFDAKAAEQIINTMQTQSDITGVQFALDIVGTTEIAFEKYIDFVPQHTDAPLMLDAMSPKTRMAAANLAKKMGLTDRCLYNSVYKGVTDAELANLKESGIKMSIVLADDPKDTTLEGKMKVIVEALALAEKGGITKPLIDTAIPAFEPDMGTSVRAIPIMKEKYGHPVGLGSGNVVTTMGWVKANVAKEFRKGPVCCNKHNHANGRRQLAHDRTSRTSRMGLPSRRSHRHIHCISRSRPRNTTSRRNASNLQSFHVKLFPFFSLFIIKIFEVLYSETAKMV